VIKLFSYFIWATNCKQFTYSIFSFYLPFFVKTPSVFLLDFLYILLSFLSYLFPFVILLFYF